MFFVNKSNSSEVIELISSGAGYCIVIDQEDTLMSENKNHCGRIIKTGKKELKKAYKKIKDTSPLIKMKPIEEELKNVIIDQFNTDKVGILEYSEEYVESKKYLDRQEEISKQSEADRRRMMKQLADDYNPNFKPKEA